MQDGQAARPVGAVDVVTNTSPFAVARFKPPERLAIIFADNVTVSLVFEMESTGIPFVAPL